MIISGRRSIRSILEYRREINPESIFFVWEKKGISYEVLDENVNRLANGLLELGAKKGVKILIHLSNCPEFVYSLFAILKIGSVAVLSNTQQSFDELTYTASHSESAFAITELDFYDLIRNVQNSAPLLKKILILGDQEMPEIVSFDAILSQCSSELKATDVRTDDDASIMYTSGSSDVPKGVLYTQGNYIFAGEVFSKQIRLTPKDRHLCVIPLFHNNALMHQLFPVVTTGASMALFKKFSSSRFADQIRQEAVTLVTIPAALIRFILNVPEKATDGQNSLRAVFSGANILTQEEFSKFCRRFNVPLITWFGQTESVACPLCSLIDGRRKEGSIGLPTLGYEVRINNENGREVSSGEIGEIVCRGLGQHSLMKGYYRDEKATTKALKDGWLHTDDMGYMDEEGYFYFVERKKEMIKVKGENVAAGEVERVLGQHPNISECAVVGTVDELGNEAIKAFIVLGKGKKFTVEEITGFCLGKLASFKVPKFFEFLDELPRTATGKVEKKLLRRTQ